MEINLELIAQGMHLIADGLLNKSTNMVFEEPVQEITEKPTNKKVEKPAVKKASTKKKVVEKEDAVCIIPEEKEVKKMDYNQSLQAFYNVSKSHGVENTPYYILKKPFTEAVPEIGRDNMLKILGKYGAKRLQDVKEELWHDFVEDMNKAVENVKDMNKAVENVE